MKKTTRFIVFFLFSFFYLLTSSRINISGVTVLRWVGCIILVLYGLISDKNKKMILKIPKVYIWLLFAFIPSFIIAHDMIFYSVGRMISLFLVCFSLEIFIGNTINSKDDIVSLYSLYTVIAAILLLISLFFPNYLGGRMTGLYYNANFLSCISVFVCVSSIGLFLYYSGFYRLIWGGAVLVSSICILMSGSRAGLFIFVFAIVIIPMIMKENNSINNILKSMAILTVIIFTIYYIINHFDIAGIDRLKLFSSSNEISNYSRNDVWKDVWKIFIEHPFLGWGYGRVGYNVFVIKLNDYVWGMHSSYFVALCELGIVGCLFVIMFFINYCHNNYVLYNSNISLINKGDKIIIKILFVCCFCLLINAYVESFLFSVGNPLSICFWLPFIALNRYLQKIQNGNGVENE